MNVRQLNILLADDDTDDCIFFKEAVVEIIPSTNFTAVNDGEQLMQHLINIVGAQNIVPQPIGAENFLPLPNVLFLDLNMPRKNGFECLEEIKQNKKLQMLPVIMFSTSFEQEVVNQLYHNGAHYFIRKPSEFSQFKKIIQHTLTLIANEINTLNSGNLPQPAKENFVLTVENEQLGVY